MSTILFGILVLAGISANPVHNSSTGAGNSSYFPVVASRQDCPDVYANFCYHGTCRFHLSEKEAYCVCFKGYVGVRCEHMDLLQPLQKKKKKKRTKPVGKKNEPNDMRRSFHAPQQET
ncbi:protransforming growth factor alpha-like isoform X2 [Pyxicephalus adspersus]|uniref:EGF-like domain-containing protein n=1 Tax=Pyxicephalus adspersus TaxID=30357 RepID=A0AAV3AJK0_PYXAD|nr:TPA: hypothetical protein GDO54_008020 [Pyxicephalus adspersus]